MCSFVHTVCPPIWRARSFYMPNIQYLYDCLFCQRSLSNRLIISELSNKELYPTPSNVMLVFEDVCYCNNYIKYKYGCIKFNARYLLNIYFYERFNNIKYSITIERNNWKLTKTDEPYRIIIQGQTNNFQPVITPGNFQEKMSKLVSFI